MLTLPGWMRRALFATAVMNILVAGAFVPAARDVRVLAGLPAESHPLYLTTVGLFVGLFGCGYLWSAITGRADRLFITLAATGKLGFFALLAGFWVAGSLPLRAPLAGTADLVFGLLFAAWLYGARGAATADVPASRSGA